MCAHCDDDFHLFIIDRDGPEPLILDVDLSTGLASFMTSSSTWVATRWIIDSSTPSLAGFSMVDLVARATGRGPYFVLSCASLGMRGETRIF
jgi:hypothetical protein